MRILIHRGDYDLVLIRDGSTQLSRVDSTRVGQLTPYFQHELFASLKLKEPSPLIGFAWN
jgi:hypothetical protein